MATFKDWYEANKEKLSAERKQRYHSDPAHRAVLRARAADYRDRKRAEKPPQAAPGLTTAEACEVLGVSEWTLSRWRECKYYPDPLRVSGRVFFSNNQVQLLGLIKQHFEQYPRRLAGLHRDELAGIADVVHHNWQG